jgi:hypothetical protein
MRHRRTSAMCWLILGTGLVLAFAPPAEDAPKPLQGTWTATQAARDGQAAADVVGQRLSVTGHRFQIQSDILRAYNYALAGWVALGELVALMLVMSVVGGYAAYLWRRRG